MRHRNRRTKADRVAKARRNTAERKQDERHEECRWLEADLHRQRHRRQREALIEAHERETDEGVSPVDTITDEA